MRCLRLGSQSSASALFDLIGKLLHGFPGKYASLAACKGCLRYVNGGQNLGSLPFALFPQRQCFFYRILGTGKPSGFDGLADERFLIGRQMYFHALKVRVRKAGVKNQRARLLACRGGIQSSVGLLEKLVVEQAR